MFFPMIGGSLLPRASIFRWISLSISLSLFFPGPREGQAQAPNPPSALDRLQGTAPDSLSEKVTWRADSTVYHVADSLVILRGNGQVTYRNMKLTAGQISFHTGTRVLTATPLRDSLTLTGGTDNRPVLEDEEGRLVGERIEYNLNTRQGVVQHGHTRYDKGFFSGDEIHALDENTLRIANGVYTTCDHDHPHYKFVGGKITIKQNDKAVVRPVIGYIWNIPVFVFPFYVFPLQRGRHSGWLVPRYGSSFRDGSYVRNLGYYWAASDYWDLKSSLDIFKKRGFLFRSNLRYAVRGRFKGSAGGSYSLDRQRRWDLQLGHTHELQPNLRLALQGNFTNTTSYYRDTSFDTRIRTRRSLRSNLSVDKRWTRNSLNLTVSQEKNLTTGITTGTLPQITFRYPRRPVLAPASRRDKDGADQWLSSVFYSYNSNFANRKQSTGYTLNFNQQTGLSSPQKLFGWLNFSPTLNYQERWNWQNEQGFESKRNYQIGVVQNTTLYGIFRPRIGSLLAIRHVVTPEVAFNLRGPTSRKTVNLRLSNVFQAKLGGSEKERKINLATLNFSTNYDFDRHNQKWSDLRTSLRVNPTKLVGLDIQSVHAFYQPQRDALRFPWLRNLNTTTTLRLVGARTDQTTSTFNPEDDPGTGSSVFERGRFDRDQRNVSSRNPWRLNLSHRYAITRLDPHAPFQTRSHWISWRSAFNPTAKWRIEYQANYQIKRRPGQPHFSSQEVMVYRDLHCWEALLRWTVSGYGKGLYFRLNIKAHPEIKLERRGNL